MALPGSSGGIVVKSSDHQRVKLGAKGLVVKPQRVRTLELHAYPAAMSLCFRAAELCRTATAKSAPSVAAALAVLQRECTRQYEEMVLQVGQVEADKIWPYVFYVRWTYLVLTSTLPTGFMADAAFLQAAKTMHSRGSSGSGGSLHTFTANSNVKASSTSRSLVAGAAGWKICFKCGEVNTHRAPVCPIISPNIAESVRESVRTSIAAAPITDAARREFLTIAKNYYAKFDRTA